MEQQILIFIINIGYVSILYINIYIYNIFSKILKK